MSVTAQSIYRLPHKPRRSELLEVEIQSLSDDGLGEVRLQAEVGPQGAPREYVLRVRDAVPGDRVRALLERVRRSELGGRVDALLAPSPLRAAPRCEHFGAREIAGRGCGGCRLQSLRYSAQLELKRELVIRALHSAGVTSTMVQPVLGQAEPWGYRNKMELSFGRCRGGQLSLGLHPLGYRYEVLSLTRCHLMAPDLAQLVAAVQRWAVRRGLTPYDGAEDVGLLRTLTVRVGTRTGQRMLELTTSDAPEAVTAAGPQPAADVAQEFCELIAELNGELAAPISSVYWTRQVCRRGTPTRFESQLLLGRATLEEQLRLPGTAPLRFEIHPRAFFQPNTLQAEVLYGQVLSGAGLGAGAARAARALDLYCGTGTIALCLAPFVEHVTGVELAPEAVDNARRNAAANGLSNARFIAGDVGKLLRGELAEELLRVDLVVVDPPRAGLLPAAVGELARVAPRKLIYVSCNPRALGRDIGLLGRAGFRLASVQPVDLFPQTAHVETVAVLER